MGSKLCLPKYLYTAYYYNFGLVISKIVQTDGVKYGREKSLFFYFT